MRNHGLQLAALCLSSFLAAVDGAERFTLDNGEISAAFDSRGLVQLKLAKSPHGLLLANDSAVLVVNGEKLAAPGLKLLDAKQAEGERDLHVPGRRPATAGCL